MKPSRYNRLFEAKDGTWLAFKSWSTALAEIETDDLPLIRALLADPDGTPCDTPHKREVREALIAAHFLLEDDVDELATLRVDMMRDRFRTDILFLTIAPTMDCNFRCDYCYEEHLKVTMSRTVQDGLLRFVDERLALANRFEVTWFGGEPLLPRAYDVVRDLSRGFVDRAQAKGAEYRATVVTNGYLLTRERMQELAALGVNQVQVTLDGPPAYHDRRRILAGGQGTFARILANMKDCADLALFQVRINVDRRNAEGAIEVAEILQAEGLGNVRVYLAQVSAAGETCGNINEACFSSPEFANTELEIYRMAAERGVPLSRYPARLGGAFCTADRANGFVIAPTGSIFKCWHHVTADPSKAMGHLIDPPQPFHQVNENAFLGFDALLKEECPSCSVLPLCQGGCPIEAMKRNDPKRGACEHYKFHLEPLLELRHNYRLPAHGGAGRGGVAGPC